MPHEVSWDFFPGKCVQNAVSCSLEAQLHSTAKHTKPNPPSPKWSILINISTPKVWMAQLLCKQRRGILQCLRYKLRTLFRIEVRSSESFLALNSFPRMDSCWDEHLCFLLGQTLGPASSALWTHDWQQLFKDSSRGLSYHQLLIWSF